MAILQLGDIPMCILIKNTQTTNYLERETGALRQKTFGAPKRIIVDHEDELLE